MDASEVTLNQSIVQKAYRGLEGANQTAEQQKLGHQTAQNLCVQIAAGLSQKGYAAACQQRGTPVQDNALIVDGFFKDVSEGNRIQRMAIGFGMGESRLDTNVDVYQRDDYISHEILQFDTHADSGQMPGLAVTGAPDSRLAAASRSHRPPRMWRRRREPTPHRPVSWSTKPQQTVDQIVSFYGEHGWANRIHRHLKTRSVSY